MAHRPEARSSKHQLCADRMSVVPLFARNRSRQTAQPHQAPIPPDAGARDDHKQFEIPAVRSCGRLSIPGPLHLGLDLAVRRAQPKGEMTNIKPGSGAKR